MKKACLFPHKQREVGMEWTAQAGYQFTSKTTLDAPAAHVFRTLEDGKAWTEWFENMSAVTWTTPDPKKVGTQRCVTLGKTQVEEHFLVWNEGKRMAFRFISSTSSLFNAAIEDYSLEEIPGSPGKCLFSYQVHADLCWWGRLLGCLIQPKLNAMFGKVGPNLAKFFKADAT